MPLPGLRSFIVRLPLFMLPTLAFAFAFPFLTRASGPARVWQWSVAVGQGRAFLWVPEECRRVRAVVLAQHNMSEEGILEHATFRSELARLGIAEVWVAPPFDPPFDFTRGAGERFESFMRGLAAESGYEELATAPVVPLGHSACATFPWNFAAWNPDRTLAVVSYKGDAPQTTLTGYGRANVPWGARSIDGIPGLMVMAEYEWLEERIAPALAFRQTHPRSPLAVVGERGRGHFDTSEEMTAFLALFIRKAAELRLPSDGAPAGLRPVDPSAGWLVPRWKPGAADTRHGGGISARAAPAGSYAADPREAVWAADEAMARAMEALQAGGGGEAPQLLGFVQEGAVVAQTATHQQVALRFLPEADGLAFALAATFLERVDGGSGNTTRWTGLPPGASIGHASKGGAPTIHRITGPAIQCGPGLFRVALNRTASTVDRRRNDIWVCAVHPGDARTKSAVQQALLRLPEHVAGMPQTIAFAPLADCRAGECGEVLLRAESDAGLPVGFYVREGPAVVEGDRLRLTPVPPRARLPLKVTVVAWQNGRGGLDPVRAAPSVERQFLLAEATPGAPGVLPEAPQPQVWGHEKTRR